MLNDSMTSPPNPATLLEDLVEDEEQSPTNNAKVFTKPALNNIAAELGVEEIPLREKKVESNVNDKTKRVDPDAKRFTAKEKGKGKADPLPTITTTRNRATGAVEKENQVKAKGIRTLSSSSVGSASSGTALNPKVKAATASANEKRTIKPATKPVFSAIPGTTMVGMKLPPGKGGARRVPIDSAEAAPVGPGWRG